MKFIKTCSALSQDGDRATALLDGLHPISFEAISEGIIRVSVKKQDNFRLSRTWSIAQGGATVPLKGHSREHLPGKRLSFGHDSQEFFTKDISVKIHSEPYYLEWSYRGEVVLSERTTGALAFGRQDHRLWHFHQLREDSRFYGLGERSGELDRRGRSFELRNVDPMGYDAKSSDPLYKLSLIHI